VTFLGVQEMDLGVYKAILAKELERGLCHPDGRDLLAELDETRAQDYRRSSHRGRVAVEVTRMGGRCPDRLGPATY
jgi:hypothetical protein